MEEETPVLQEFQGLDTLIFVRYGLRRRRKVLSDKRQEEVGETRSQRGLNWPLKRQVRFATECF